MKLWSAAVTAPAGTLQWPPAPTCCSASETHTDTTEASNCTVLNRELKEPRGAFIRPTVAMMSLCCLNNHWLKQKKGHKPEICKLNHFIVHIQTSNISFMSSGCRLQDRFRSKQPVCRLLSNLFHSDWKDCFLCKLNMFFNHQRRRRVERTI